MCNFQTITCFQIVAKVLGDEATVHYIQEEEKDEVLETLQRLKFEAKQTREK